MRPREQIELGELLAMLEIHPKDFPMEIVKGQIKFEPAVKRLEKFKELAKSQYKKVALKIHPDVNPSEDAKERMQKLNLFMDAVKSMRVQRVPVRPAMHHMYVKVYNFGGSTTAGDTWTNTAYTSW